MQAPGPLDAPPGTYVVAGTMTGGRAEMAAEKVAAAVKEPALPLDREPTNVKLAVQSIGVYSPADLEKITGHIKKQEEVMKKLEAKVRELRGGRGRGGGTDGGGRGRARRV